MHDVGAAGLSGASTPAPAAPAGPAAARRRRRSRARAGSADRPEMACGHSPGWPSSLAAIVAALPARSDPSVPSTREASRSNSTASSAEMPRWRSPLSACVIASANVRVAARGIVVLARQRLGRLAIGGHAGGEAEAHAWRPAAARIRWRRLTIGSRTMPVVPDSARPSSACGSAGLRPRPRKRARSVSHSSGPCGRPSRLSAWNAQAAGIAGIARPAMARAGRRCPAGTRSRRTACRTPGGRDRWPPRSARSRRSW